MQSRLKNLYDDRQRMAGRDAQLLALLAASMTGGVGALGTADLVLGDKKAWNSGEIPLNAMLSLIPALSGGVGYGAYTLADPILREQFLNFMSKDVAHDAGQVMGRQTFRRADGTTDGINFPLGVYEYDYDAAPFKSQKVQMKDGVAVGPGVSPKREAEAKKVLADIYESAQKQGGATVDPVNDYKASNAAVLNRRHRNRMAATALATLLGGGFAVNQLNKNDNMDVLGDLKRQALLAHS